MANPHIDDVFKECFKAMNDGAKALKMDVNAKGHEILKTRYYDSFDYQLKQSEKAWEKSQKKVLHAATHIGKLAAALAGFEEAAEVGEKHAEAAGMIMEEQCKTMTLVLGQWCEPFRQPQAD